MRLQIIHRTVYRFSGPVFLEPHTLRLTPRGDPAQRLERFSLAISPSPQASGMVLDAFGNTVHRCWFLGLTDTLELHTESVVQTLRDNPFDFLGEPLESLAGTREWEALAPSLARTFHAPEDVAAVSTLVQDAIHAAGLEPMAFCAALCSQLHGRLEKVARPEAGVLPPQAVLGSGQAACRDMALLFMDCCRAVGLPARFVSGYQLPALDPDDNCTGASTGASSAGTRELHAWAEVYLPGGGWRGFDPTHGLLAADRHVAVAAAPHWEDAMPVTGSYRGTGVHAVLEHEVQVREA
ncbi:transglutaminase family protein [Megalodesulfovibrio paquesii]